MQTDSDPTPPHGTPRTATLADYTRDIVNTRDLLRTITTLAGALTYTVNTPTGTAPEVATRIRQLSAMLADAATDLRDTAKNVAAAIAD